MAAELICRRWLGLGDPPLFVYDPKIEYLMKPGRYLRFGNITFVNSFSMRSAEIPPLKLGDEFRVLALGDSVLNGGAQTDQPDIATELLAAKLSRSHGTTATVLNASAGSWGPGNQLAYLEKLGTFEADIAVLILNSEDWGDVPTFEPLGVNQPTRPPLLALTEAISRYLPRYIPALAPARAPSSAVVRSIDQTGPESIAALEKTVALLRSRRVPICAVLSPKRTELENGPEPGRTHLSDTLARLGVPFVTLDEAMRRSLDSGTDPFRDEIHPNAVGQGLLAEAMEQAIEKLGHQ